MYLKRFHGQTLTDALRAVREALGPDALVLSTSLVRRPGARGFFGGRVFEVTAALERPEMSEDRRSPSVSRTRPGVAEIAARLGASGLDPAVALLVAESHPVSGRRWANATTLHSTLATQLASLAAPDDGFAPVEVFVGPPGVGKTTTIAKIAARERARNGRRLGLVAADGYRVGAVEQLRLYAGIIGSTLTVARNLDELDSALEGARRPLLLDTPGRSPGDDVSRDIFRRVGRRADVRTHLVIAASTSPSTAKRTLERFRDANPVRIVVTKLDEVDSLAPLIGVLRDCAIPISFVGTGQRVPDDLHRATPPAIAAWVLGDERLQGATV
jgi:flagellar biosynthesis protein FlhF